MNLSVMSEKIKVGQRCVNTLPRGRHLSGGIDMANVTHLNSHELAWAAGFFDGEGSTLVDTAPSGSLTAVVNVSQVDREPLDRLVRATGLGKVGGPYESRRPNNQPIYQFKIYRSENVDQFLMLLWPWLGSVKKRQAEEVRRRVNEQPRGTPGGPRPWRVKTHCDKGHPLRQTDSGHKWCFFCAQERYQLRNEHRTRQSRLSPEQVAAICLLGQDKVFTYKEIARLVSCSEGTVRRILHGFGISRNTPRRTRG